MLNLQPENCVRIPSLCLRRPFSENDAVKREVRKVQCFRNLTGLCAGNAQSSFGKAIVRQEQSYRLLPAKCISVKRKTDFFCALKVCFVKYCVKNRLQPGVSFLKAALFFFDFDV